MTQVVWSYADQPVECRDTPAPVPVPVDRHRHLPIWLRELLAADTERRDELTDAVLAPLVAKAVTHTDVPITVLFQWLNEACVTVLRVHVCTGVVRAAHRRHGGIEEVVG